MKRFLSITIFALFAGAFFLQPPQAMAQVPAFPGAYGFGASATGGRGGTVYHVTNLNDSGTGSFRDAVSAGNRIVVFDVGGYVVLLSAVSVSSDLTIEGQTAPGGGIGLMAAEVSLSGKSNIIIRNVRFRQGNEDPDTGKSAINVGDGDNIVLDHCSFEYGQFDSVDAVGVTNFTVQNCIIANPIGQQFGAHVEVGPDTFYRNLWVNAHNRQPLAKSDTQYINNVIYDYQAGYTVANTGGDFSHDIISNYFITGPKTTSAGDDYYQIDTNQSAYAVGNYLDSNNDGVLNGSPANTIGSAAVLSAPWASTTSSIPTLSMAPTSSCQVNGYTSVIESCGAFPRDSVDSFVITDVTSLGKSGDIYTNQADTGLANNGYGTLAAGTMFTETSGDGIPDYWASANGISTTSASAGTALYGSTGYTNVEAYANSLVLPNQWTAADLPGTPRQGASSFNTFTNQWLLTGSGTASATAITQGQFASQPWASDGTLSAELLTLGGSSSEGGLLLGTPGSATVALVRGASGTLSFIWGTGSSTQNVQTTVSTLPLYLKITGSAGTYTASYSTNGTTYTQLGQAALSLGSTPQAGLILASGSASALGTASFTNLAVTPSGCGTPTPTPGASTPTKTNTPVPPTATPTSTATRTNTSVPPTSTPTSSATSTATRTNTLTATPSSTATRTNTPVPPTSTFTATNTPSPTATSTPAATKTNTPIPPTATFTFTSTRTNTPVPPTATNTPVPPTATFTNSPMPPTSTFTNVPPTMTNTAIPPTATATQVPPTSTNTSVPPTSTNTQVPPTATRTSTSVPPTPTSSNTAMPTATSTKTASMTPTASLTASATASNTPTLTSTSSWTPTASPTKTDTPVPPTATSTNTLTATRTNTPVPPTPTFTLVPPALTFTPTPLPPTFTPTVVAASSSLKVQLLSGVTSDTTNSPHPQIQVVNTGTGPLSLNNVTVKYWFNCDCTNQTVQAWVDWAGLMPSGSMVTGDVQVSVQNTILGGQTNYVLYTFTGNLVLQPGQAIQIQSRFNKSDWSNMTQSNDWSFAANTSYQDAAQVTGYIGGGLVWGQEPVSAPAALTVSSALAFPNPSTGTGATLSFNLNGTQTGPTGSLLNANQPLLLDPNAKVTLSIYTLSMRLIWTQTLTGGAYGTTGNHEVYWNEKDLKGAGLANGIYLLRVTVDSHGTKSSTTAKILILQ